MNDDQYQLTLYVSGQTARTRNSIRRLYEICERELPGRYELEIVDILEQPQVAEDERILATPMLVRKLPPPLRRIIGDLSETEGVLLSLDIQPTSDAEPEGDR